MRKILFFLTFFYFLLISLPIFAVEPEKLYLNTNENRKIKIENVSRFILSEPNILSVEVSKDEINLKGLRNGQSTLYLWQNGKFSSYIVFVTYVQRNENNNGRNTSHRNLYKLVNPDSAYGIYSLSSSINFNNLKNQSYNNNIMYKFPVNEHDFTVFNNKFTLPKSEINFNANSFVQLSDFSLNKLTLQNLNANLTNNLFNLNVGDISSSGSSSVSQLRGFNFTLKNEKYQYNMFSGFDVEATSIYSNNNITDENKKIRDNFFTAGLSGSYKMNDIFSFSGGLSSRRNLFKSDLSTDKLMIGSSINLPNETLKNTDLTLQTGFQSDFYTYSFQISPSYKYKWSDINQSFGIGLSYSFSNEDFSYIGSPSRNYISLSSIFIHPSQLNLNTSVSYDSLINRKNAIAGLSKSFFNGIYNLYISDDYLVLDTYARNNIIFGNKINAFSIPFSLEYQYTSNITNKEKNLNNDVNSLKLNVNSLYFGPFNASLASQGAYSNWGTRKDLSLNFSSSINYDIQNFSTLTFNGNYNINIRDLSKNIRQDSFIIGLQTSFNIQPYHKFNINMNMGGNLFENVNRFNFMTNVVYTLEFGREYESLFATGDIKGIVYEDSNDNQIFDEGEKIVEKVKVFIDDDNSYITDKNGYTLKNLLQKSQYCLYIDESTLPAGYKVTSEYPIMTNLDSKVKEVNFAIRKQVIIKGHVYGNKSKTKSLEGIEIFLDNKESITTNSSGDFEFKTEVGEHTLMVAPPSIPLDYSVLKDEILKTVNIEKSDAEAEFIFFPRVNLIAKVYMTDSQKIKELAKNMTFKIKYKYEDISKEKIITTDENGSFALKGLEEGKLEIKFELMKKPFVININDSDMKTEFNLYQDNNIISNDENRKSSDAKLSFNNTKLDEL